MHGVSNRVYSLLSTRSFQLNALFTFLQQSDKQTQVHLTPRLRAGHAWFSHPGNYLTDFVFLLPFRTTVFVHCSSFVHGMSVYLNHSKVEMAPSTKMVLAKGDRTMATLLTFRDKHALIIRDAAVTVTIVNANGFCNVEELVLHDSTAAMTGLIGWTAALDSHNVPDGLSDNNEIQSQTHALFAHDCTDCLFETVAH